jgi:hypothetical protein
MENSKQTPIHRTAKALNIKSPAAETTKPRTFFPIGAYSLDMCMKSCAGMNARNMTETACGAVAFRADMANVTNLGGSRFWNTGCDSPRMQM